MLSEKFDAVVIGGGVIGCSVAMHLARDKRRVVVLEEQESLGTSTSSRNSGVLHSGIYFKQNLLKTRLCVEGQPLIYEWAEKQRVPFRKIGKLVVSFSQEEDALLTQILDQAHLNGCRGIDHISKALMSQKFSFLNSPSEAILCRETGIIDPNLLTLSYAEEARENGAQFRFGHRIEQIQPLGANSFQIETANRTIKTELLINSAGLNASQLASEFTENIPETHPCRGDYFGLTMPYSIPHLVYPTKNPLKPGLGIHLTLDLNGNMRMGPDATYLKNEPIDLEKKKQIFSQAVHRMFVLDKPPVLEHRGFGIRPKLSKRGEPEKDFYIQEDLPGWWNLLGIESPGLTASYRIGQYLQERIFSST